MNARTFPVCSGVDRRGEQGWRGLQAWSPLTNQALLAGLTGSKHLALL